MSAQGYLIPQQIDDLQLAFPAALGALLPPLEAIPDDYPNRRDWERFQSQWFAGTLPPGTYFRAVPGVDAVTAGRHLEAIQGSFEPKHEHKAAAVAWLASLWLAEVVAGDGAIVCPPETSSPS